MNAFHCIITNWHLALMSSPFKASYRKIKKKKSFIFSAILLYYYHSSRGKQNKTKPYGFFKKWIHSIFFIKINPLHIQTSSALLSLLGILYAEHLWTLKEKAHLQSRNKTILYFCICHYWSELRDSHFNSSGNSFSIWIYGYMNIYFSREE